MGLSRDAAKVRNQRTRILVLINQAALVTSIHHTSWAIWMGTGMYCSHFIYDLQPLWTLTVLLIISWVLQVCGLMSLQWYAARNQTQMQPS